MVDERATPLTPEPAPATAPEPKAPPAEPRAPQPAPSTEKPPAKPAAAKGPAPVADEVDIDALLSRAGDKLWEHPTVQGKVGTLAERQAARERERWQAEQAEKERKDERERIRQMRRSDPVGYAELMEAKDAEEEARKERDRLRTDTRGEFARMVGASFHALPEWKELSKDDLNALAKMVSEKDDDSAIATFNQAALDLIARRRAERVYQERYRKDLVEERKAWQREYESGRLKGEPAPDLRRASGPVRFNPDAMSDKEFDQWYEANVLNRVR